MEPGRPDNSSSALRDRLRQVIEADLAREDAVARELRARIAPVLRTAVEAARAAGLLGGRAWLIGSYAWGQPTVASDVDLLVESAADRGALAARISEAVGLDVDVIRVREADPALLPHLQREGMPL